ncbi:hypothetical protein ACLI09_17810, partial [Flavobacterium sp. RHBU_24]|uniref:hypothetical protein n=1 Tax=Flavobacterium sp. RHBU_24 TaxID=3391185 RepID=UPI0039848D19
MNLFDFLKDLSDSAKDRLKTPITGSFALAFLIWNWRPIIFLIFSDSLIEDKIVVINHEYSAIGNFLGPLFVAVIYVVGVPYSMMYLERASGDAEKARIIFKGKLKEEKARAVQEALKIEADNTDIKTGNRDRNQLVIL